MAFQKGKSGNPGGRPKDKPWADALRLVVFRDDMEGKRRLLAIAEKCAESAMNGDMQAIKEIGDRLDGRPAQEQHNTNETTVRYVARVPDKEATVEAWTQKHSQPMTH